MFSQSILSSGGSFAVWIPSSDRVPAGNCEERTDSWAAGAQQQGLQWATCPATLTGANELCSPPPPASVGQGNVAESHENPVWIRGYLFIQGFAYTFLPQTFLVNHSLWQQWWLLEAWKSCWLCVEILLLHSMHLQPFKDILHFVVKS